jgi:hypothetical protein
MLVNHVGGPNDCSFVGVGWEKSVKHVVGDVDLSVEEPTSEGRVLGIKDSFGEGEPFHFLGLFLPESFSELWGSSSSKCLIVGVLCHEIKIIMAVSALHLKNPPAKSVYTPLKSSSLFLQLPKQ